MRQRLVQVLRRADESVEVKDAIVRLFWSPTEPALSQGAVIDLARWVSERRGSKRR
jgi:hypothetical protein